MRARGPRGWCLWTAIAGCTVLVACGGNGGDADAPGDTAGDGTDAADVDGSDQGEEACIPATCEALGVACGPVDRGCGITDDCGACGVNQQCESGACLDCGPDGCDPECTAATWADDCAVRACEEPTGCDVGRCVYAPVDCSTGDDCPRRECRATELPDGGFENACIEVPFGACASCAGAVCGMCVDATCVVAPPAATFVTTSLAQSTSAMRVTGNISTFLPAAGRMCEGTVCVTGGLLP
jgi:hypothetical protein